MWNIKRSDSDRKRTLEREGTPDPDPDPDPDPEAGLAHAGGDIARVTTRLCGFSSITLATRIVVGIGVAPSASFKKSVTHKNVS